VTRAEDRPVAVVQGYGPDVGWAMLAEACVAVRAGARWVATNTDATMPSPRGPVPGNGALVAALATALGRGPDVVVGKPAPGLLEAAARRRDARRALVVGDRLDTDVEGAVRAGMDSLLVLTGVTTPADLLAAPAHRRPTHVAANLGGLSEPDDAVRVPRWADGSVVHGGWRVTVEDRHLVLTADIEARDPVDARDPATAPDPAGAGDSVSARDSASSRDSVGALRALAVAAWQCPQWTAIRADAAGRRAVTALGLASYLDEQSAKSPAGAPSGRATGASGA